jgi:hypothetical protein
MRIGRKAETPSAESRRAWGPVSWDSGGCAGWGNRHLGIKSNTRCPFPQLRSGINVDVETLMKKLRLSTVQGGGKLNLKYRAAPDA